MNKHRLRRVPAWLLPRLHSLALYMEISTVKNMFIFSVVCCSIHKAMEGCLKRSEQCLKSSMVENYWFNALILNQGTLNPGVP